MKWTMVLLSITVMGLAGRVLGEETPKLPGDAEIRKMVAGTWAYAGTTATNTVKVNHQNYIFGDKGELKKELIYTANGKEVKETSSGTWDVKDGAIVTTVLKTVWPSGETKEVKSPITLHMKVVSLSEH